MKTNHWLRAASLTAALALASAMLTACADTSASSGNSVTASTSAASDSASASGSSAISLPEEPADSSETSQSTEASSLPSTSLSYVFQKQAITQMRISVRCLPLKQMERLRFGKIFWGEWELSQAATLRQTAHSSLLWKVLILQKASYAITFVRSCLPCRITIRLSCRLSFVPLCPVLYLAAWHKSRESGAVLPC